MSKEPWHRFQEDIATWQKKTMPPSERTPELAFRESFEEVVELSEAVDEYDGSLAAKREIGEEATDVIIRMLGLITIVGGNAAKLIEHKIGTMQKKYPADIIEEQLANGVPRETVMRSHKDAWNGNGARVIPLFRA